MLPPYLCLQYNAKFWRAPIGRNRSRDAIVSLLSGRLSAHGARFWQVFTQTLALYNKNNRFILSQALCVIGSLGKLMFKLKLRSRANICREHQISSGNLSHDSAFNRRTLLFVRLS